MAYTMRIITSCHRGLVVAVVLGSQMGAVTELREVRIKRDTMLGEVMKFFGKGIEFGLDLVKLIVNIAMLLPQCVTPAFVMRV